MSRPVVAAVSGWVRTGATVAPAVSFLRLTDGATLLPPLHRRKSWCLAGLGKPARLPEVVVGLHRHPHLGGGVERGFELEGHGGGDAGASVEEAGEGGPVDAEAGGEGGHFAVAHEFLKDFAGVCGVVHWHGGLF